MSSNVKPVNLPPKEQSVASVLNALQRYNRVTLKQSIHPAGVGSCVQDSVVMQQVLKQAFGLESEVACADYFAWNANYEIGTIARSQNREPAFNRRLAPPYAVECWHGHSESGGRHSGHALVLTRDLAIDPTIGQVWRRNPRGLLLDPVPMLTWSRRLFTDLEQHPQSWLTRPRPKFLHTESLASGAAGSHTTNQPMTMADLAAPLRNYGSPARQVSVLRIGQDCWMATLLRPDLNIESVYARWHDAEFQAWNDHMAETLLAMLGLPRIPMGNKRKTPNRRGNPSLA